MSLTKGKAVADFPGLAELLNEAQCQHLQQLLTDWPNCHNFDGNLHRITSHTLNCLIRIHQNKWRHQIQRYNTLLSKTSLLNFLCPTRCMSAKLYNDGWSHYDFSFNTEPEAKAYGLTDVPAMGSI